MSRDEQVAAEDRDVVSIDDLTERLRALLGIAEDGLALLDRHISEEQRKELGIRMVGRLA